MRREISRSRRTKIFGFGRDRQTVIPLDQITGCRAVHGKINTYVRESLIYRDNYVLILWVLTILNCSLFVSYKQVNSWLRDNWI